MEALDLIEWVRAEKNHIFVKKDANSCSFVKNFAYCATGFS